MYWNGKYAHYFYAYYPYNSSHTGASTAVPISLAAEQTQSEANNSDHIGALDFMVATPVTATGTSGATTSGVNFKYNHVFTVIEFQVQGTGTLKAIRLQSPESSPIAFDGGTIDITKSAEVGAAYTIASKTGTSDIVSITLSTAITLSDTPQSVYMVINSTIQTGVYTLGQSADGTTWNNTFLNIGRAAPSGGFKRGNKYVRSTLLKVGDYYAGGMVGYILNTGQFNGVNNYESNVQHGFIISLSVTGATAWITGGSTQDTFNGNTSGLLGSGKANTAAMVAQAGYTGGAAKLCTDSSEGGYNDWFLPSFEELYYILIGGNEKFYDSVSTTPLWSSSEYSSTLAYGMRYSPFGYGDAPKSQSDYQHVLRVRAF